MSQTGFPPREDNPLLGIGFMVLGMASLSTMDAVAKHLIADFTAAQILVLRGGLILPLLFVWAAWTKGVRSLATRRPVAHGVRVLCAFAAPMFFFTSLQYLPLADVTVVAFGGTFFLTALSVPLLKEKVGIHRWGAVVVGFLGVLVVVQPTGQGFHPAAIMTVLASLAYALLMIATRWLSRSESTVALIFYQNLGVTVLAGLWMPFVWQPVPVSDWGMVCLMAALALAGQVFITKAFMIAPVGAVAPFEYSALVGAAVLGYVFFGDVPQVQVWLGAGLIVVAGLYTVHREARAQRVEKAVVPLISE
jgi:drug/metabolite transporter (DMT)-like permease